VAIVLQNRRGLDLITVEKRGICVFLGEKCCFYANQSGIVRESAHQLLERIQGKKQGNILEYRMEELGPLTVLLRLLLVGPCVVNLTRFIHSQPDERR
jgi:hypothetical protein